MTKARHCKEVDTLTYGEFKEACDQMEAQGYVLVARREIRRSDGQIAVRLYFQREFEF